MKSKSTSRFPHPNQADDQGLVAVGGDLSSEVLVDAYSHGIFPWPQESMPLLWFSPPERGVLDFDEFKVPKSVDKLIKKQSFRITKNQAFEQVIALCARIPRDGETVTWFLPAMEEAYVTLHQQGLAHSYEAWRGGDLVGGLYGVSIGGLFSGESMFFTESGASKVCLVQLVEDLRGEGHQWMDIQMVTPVLALFGGKYIAREDFLHRLQFI